MKNPAVSLLRIRSVPGRPPSRRWQRHDPGTSPPADNPRPCCAPAIQPKKERTDVQCIDRPIGPEDAAFFGAFRLSTKPGPAPRRGPFTTAFARGPGFTQRTQATLTLELQRTPVRLVASRISATHCLQLAVQNGSRPAGASLGWRPRDAREIWTDHPRRMKRTPLKGCNVAERSPDCGSEGREVAPPLPYRTFRYVGRP